MTTLTTSGLPVSRKRLRGKSENGIALILTLAILVMVTLLVVAFAISMRVENTASKNFNDLLKARQLAQGAVDQAVATIRQATTRNGGSILDYVTFPGVIYDYNGTPGTGTAVPLYSVNAASPTNLNADFWITQTNGEFLAAAPAGAQFNVGWLYVAEDGTVGPSPLVAHGAIVGRFAFWTDDEASKINLNTAGGSPLPVPPSPDYGTSSNHYVDLSMLLPLPGPYGFGSAITTRQGTPGYATIEEVKLADPSESDFTANRFSLTAYSNDANYPNYVDDLDSFGVPRRVLLEMTNANAIAIDIDNTPGTNISAYTRLSDPAKLGTLYSGGTFNTKYPVVGTADGLKQIIANIMAYQIDPATQWPPDDGSTPPVYLGLAKVPYINEVHVHYDFAGVSPNFTATRTVKVELIYQYDTAFNGRAGDNIVISGLDTLGSFLTPTATIPASGVMLAGGPPGAPTYQVLTFVTDLNVNVGGGPAKLLGPNLTVTYTRDYPGKPGARLNVAQMQIGSDNSPALPGTSDAGAEVNDPAVNMSSGQWKPYKGTGTMGSQNNPPPLGPYLPSETPPSKTVIRGAPMLSVGELGYIHTPSAWTYLTLQPGGGGGVIPDWAILDSFTVGNTVIPNVTAGRININSFINPGGTGPTTPRLVPLKALLNSIITPPDTVAGNIYNDARPTDTYGMNTGPDGIFDTIGEICEATGVADSGVNQADREKVVRRIANLITVRSSTFTIWVMAQTIKQPPINSTPGTYNPAFDTITGEVRVQAVVERYEVGGVPRFRVRYFRYL